MRASGGAMMESRARFVKNPAKLGVLIRDAAKNVQSHVLPAVKYVLGLVLTVEDARWPARCHAIYYRAQKDVRKF